VYIRERDGSVCPAGDTVNIVNMGTRPGTACYYGNHAQQSLITYMLAIYTHACPLSPTQVGTLMHDHDPAQASVT
jgi:hypothetical protein